MDAWKRTEHGVVKYKLMGTDDEVQQQINLLFEAFPYEEYQTFISHDEMKEDGTRVVEMEHNQYRTN